MTENEDNVDIYNSWCKKVKSDLEKMENEYNEMINSFNAYIDRYSIGTDYSKLVETNQIFGEITVLIYVGRQLLHNTGVDFVEYENKLKEQVFKILNLSAEIINRILNRIEPVDDMYFYGEYNNLRRLVYEMLNKRVSH